MKSLVAIIGPTGIGKSKTALHLAQYFDSEVMSADSRQVYRHMDIGTAKPSPQELSLVPHHLMDIVDPDEDFNLAQYQRLACQVIADIQQRNKLPLLVGGSGLYAWSVLEDWQIPEVPPDFEYRQSLEEKAKKMGKDELYQKLVKVDPIAAQKIDKHNIRRVIRALEVHQRTGASSSQLQRKNALKFGTLIIGLTANRSELYRRIDVRLDEMIGKGLVEETKKLLEMGYSLELPSMSGIGYKQIGMFLKDEMSLDAAIQQIKYETHRFVRHQYNWFRLKDDRIRWFDIQSKPEPEIAELLSNFIGKVEVS